MQLWRKYGVKVNIISVLFVLFPTVKVSFGKKNMMQS